MITFLVSNIQLRSEYPSVASLTNADYGAAFSIPKDTRSSSPTNAGEPATATASLNITRTAPSRPGIDDRFEKKKAARNNKNKKKETIIKPEQDPNYVGDKLEVDELVNFVDDCGEAAAGSASNNVKSHV